MSTTKNEFSLTDVASTDRPSGTDHITLILSYGLRLALPTMLFLIGLTGCSEGPQTQFKTRADTAKLVALRSHNVALLSVAFQTNAFAGLKDINAPVAKLLLEKHASSIQNGFSSLFTFQSITNSYPVTLYKPALDVSNAKEMRQLVQTLKVDAAFVLRCSYGHKFENQVDWYYLVVDTYILDREGQVVWNFDGKASLILSALKYTVLDSVSREFASPPSKTAQLPASFGPAMSFMIERYTSYTRWLVEQDMIGSAQKSYAVDYPASARKADGALGLFVIVPSSHEVSFIPSLSRWTNAAGAK